MTVQDMRNEVERLHEAIAKKSAHIYSLCMHSSSRDHKAELEKLMAERADLSEELACLQSNISSHL